MALADSYDLLMSERPSGPPVPHSEAMKLIEKEKAQHFDPEIVNAFLSIEDRFRSIAYDLADSEEERAAAARKERS